MNKKHIIISSSLIALIAVAAQSMAHAQNVPATSVDQSAGLLGSPVAQLPLQDPAIRQALDWIQSNQAKQVEHKFERKPDTTISRFGTDRRTVILGGPEVVPM